MKRTNKNTSSTSYDTTDTVNEIKTAMIRLQNIDLAKELNETKISLAQMISQRDWIQQELFYEKARNKMLMNAMKRVDNISKGFLSNFVSMSKDVTDLMEVISSVSTNVDRRKTLYTSVLQPNQVLMSQESKPKSPSKTQAVSPMVSGHVILRPTVKLTRVSELSSLTQQNDSTNDERAAEGEEADNTQDEEMEVDGEVNSSNEQSLHHNNIHLSTLNELDEENSVLAPVNSLGNNSILSGFFRDVRVYVTPTKLEPHQINYCKRFSKESNPKKKFSRTNSLNQSQDGVNKSETNDASKSMTESHVSDDSNKEMNSTLPQTPLNSTASHSKLALDSYDPLEGPSSRLTADPLEGPSNLLDSFEDTILKERSLAALGLVPVLSKTSTPRDGNSENTPDKFVTRRLRRSRRPISFMKRQSAFELKQDISERNSSAIITPEKVLKVNVIRENFSSPKTVKSPIKQNVGSPKKYVKSPIDCVMPRRSLTGILSPTNIKRESPKKKTKRNRKLYKSPIKATNKQRKGWSPEKRPKRTAAPNALKEPSLIRKLRRS